MTGLLAIEPPYLIGNDVNTKQSTGLLLGLTLGFATCAVQAQTMDASTTASPTRSQVKMETKEFLRTHRWDATSDTWSLKTGIEPPTGVVPRSEVKAQRDEYMRLNRWDETSDSWIPRKPALPAISSLTREQVRAETMAFTRTHTWDDEGAGWVANPPAKAK